MKHFKILLLTILVSFSAAAQNINDYQYVLVPTRFEFMSYADKFQINSLTTFLFNREGFKAYENTLESIPAEVASNKCTALYVDVKEKSGIIRTRLQIELKDCDGNVIFLSEVGDSKLKDYTRAYHQALREAFMSIENLNYSYKPKSSQSPKAVSPATDLATVAKKEKKQSQIQVLKTESDTPLTITHKSSPQVLLDTEDDSVEMPAVYISENSSYSIVHKNDGYIIYDDVLIIGKAEETAEGQFLITTSSFNGVGRLEGDSFIIDRQIKGVSGLVQMIFTKQ